jgi:3-isopropylmalate/(R)-2-methylmalate dehydratase small subunit
MERFVSVEGIAAPLLRINIDTDQITPGKELVRMRSEGAAPSLFAYWRYIGDREPNPDFILNRAPWSNATILLADRNFGCGSSRETAPMALRAWGFRAVIAPSFGGIFFNNCFRNGLLPVEMPIEPIRRIAQQMEAAQGRATVKVDLQSQTVTGPDGMVVSFATPKVLREMLLEGADEIDLTLRRSATIASFRDRDRAHRPWAYRAR